MEKRTLLAVVLSVVVITGSYLIQSWFFPPTTPAQPNQTNSQLVEQQPTAETPTGNATVLSEAPVVAAVNEAEPAAVAEERTIIETDLVRVELTNRGGDIVSYKLKKHLDKGDFVEMVLPGKEESHAFSVAFGGIDARPVNELFQVRKISDTTVEFYRDFTIPGTGT